MVRNKHKPKLEYYEVAVISPCGLYYKYKKMFYYKPLKNKK